MRFTAQNEGLFLLDEPDTHLNPSWCLDYLKNLRKYGVEPPNSQVILTTHSPLTFAGLEKQEVVILKRKSGRIFAEHPTSSPRGLGFSAILTSEMFGLRSSLDRETLIDVERLRQLAALESRTEEEERELSTLNSSLSRLGFSRDFRDPLFSEFVQELHESGAINPDAWQPVLSSNEKKRRAEMVRDVAKRLKDRQESE